MTTGAPYFEVELDSDSTPVSVQARGELDAATAVGFADQLAEAQALGKGVALDLEDVSFIDSSGLRAITTEVRRARESGELFAISAASESVRRIFAMTGLDTLLDPAT